MAKKIMIAICAITCFVAFSWGERSDKALASSFKSELMSEEFTDDGFSTDNWRLVSDTDGDGNPVSDIFITDSENSVGIYGPTYDAGTAVYIDKYLNVADVTGQLIVEFDIVNDEPFPSMFSVITGMPADSNGNVTVNDARRSQMIMCGGGGNFMNVQSYGLPGSYEGYAPFDIWVGSHNYGGFCHDNVGGYGVNGYRYKLVYSNGGSLYTYRYKILENGGYGEEEERLFVPSGMAANGLSGYTGFFFWYVTSPICLKNIKISTKTNQNAEENTEFEDAGDSGKLNEKWKTVNGNALVSVVGAPRSVIFNNPSDDNYLVSAGSKTIAYDAVYDEYIKMTFKLTLSEIEGNRKFGVVFGLSTSRDNTDTDGANYIYFSRASADKINLCAEQTQGNEKIASNTVGINASDLMGKTVDVSLIPYVSGKTDVVINGKTYTLKIDAHKIVLDKRFAFIASGGNRDEGDKVVAGIASVKITNRYDSVPEYTFDLQTGFGGKDANGNPWYDKTQYSFGGGVGYAGGDLNAGVFMEDGVLKFRNAGHNSYFSPLSAYGDFMMQLDITDISRENAYSENGEIYRSFMRSWIGFTFGLPSGGSPYTSGYLLYITPTYKAGGNDPDPSHPSPKYFEPCTSAESPSPIILLAPSGAAVAVGYMRHNLIDPELKDKVITVRLTVDSGMVSFSYYVKGEESITMLDVPVITWDNGGYGYGHNGYLGVTCTSASDLYMAGDFAIDNVVVRSLERNVNISKDPDKPLYTGEEISGGNGSGGEKDYAELDEIEKKANSAGCKGVASLDSLSWISVVAAVCAMMAVKAKYSRKTAK
ncbi:MAG: hypothetical protein IJU84_07130 [Clostridia bacterium]|nr:hypothetical protein [Clostridia bacterium]